MRTTTTLPYPHRRDDEIAINARLLYLYVGCPTLRYEEWAASLHLMISSRDYPPQFRLMTGDDGELALSVTLAFYFAQLGATNIMGTIASVLIEEGCKSATKGDIDQTNKMLNYHQILALAKGRTHAESLHDFLQVEKPFIEWVTDLKRKYAMKYKSDYVRLYFDKAGAEKHFAKDNGKGAMMFTHDFAMKIATAEPTRRGELLRIFTRYFN